MAVVGNQQALADVKPVHRRQQVKEVLGGGAFPQHQVHAEAQALPAFLGAGALVIGSDAGQPVGGQLFAGETGGMAVDDLPVPTGLFDLGPDAGNPVQNPGHIHQFSQAQDPGVGEKGSQVFCFQPGPVVFQVGGRHTGGQGEKDVKGQVFRGLQKIPDAFRTPDVGQFVGIRNDGGG